MTDSPKNKKRIQERPLNPTRNATDLLGDTIGRAGVTTGSPKQTSAEPTDKPHETEFDLGGIKNFPGPTDTGVPLESTNNRIYNDDTKLGLSDTYKAKAEEMASGNEDATSGDQDAEKNDNQQAGPLDVPGNYSTNPTQGAVSNRQPDEINEVDDANRKEPYAKVPSSLGEQSVSGAMPDPGSDDDTLQNAQNVGTQMDEDPEHPKELDVARDVDKAEEYHREH